MSLRLSDKLATSISLPQEGIASFIRKTYELLEEQSHCDIVSWSDCGNFLVIKDIQKFTQRILPVYFKHNKMNSFIRQLNMYNFRKKRTMNAYHVYFNDLFKRGKMDLLPLIKRKISDTPSSPAPSDYQSPQHYSSGKSQQSNNDLSYENIMLKKLNQKAVNKIATLEAKIADLIHENKVLFKKVSEKQRKEEYLHNAFSQCYQPQPQQGYAPYPITVKSEFQLVQLTPETDYTSSPDTFLAYDNEISASAESSEFQANPAFDSNSYSYQETSFLGKRTHKNYETLPWEEDLNIRSEPAKLPCFGLYEDAEDKRINLLDPEFQAFSSDMISSAF